MSALNGGTYKGQWRDDLQEGHGVEEWGKDHSKFEGEFVKGFKQGLGK